MACELMPDEGEGVEAMDFRIRYVAATAAVAEAEAAARKARAAVDGLHEAVRLEAQPCLPACDAYDIEWCRDEDAFVVTAMRDYMTLGGGWDLTAILDDDGEPIRARVSMDALSVPPPRLIAEARAARSRSRAMGALNGGLTVPTATGGVFHLRLADIAEALAVMTGATVRDAQRELSATVARLTDVAAYPAPVCEEWGDG